MHNKYRKAGYYMAKQTILQEVKDRMAGMIAEKTAQLDKIRQLQQEARTQIEAAGLAMKKATEQMDVDAYEAAKTAKRKAQTALDMYAGRYKQIEAQEYISEADSDKVVDSLLEYEDRLTEDFKAALVEHLKVLAELLENYSEAVKDTEQALVDWQQNIHLNYNSRGRATYTDEFTGERTYRSPSPIPVRVMGYTGCPESSQLREYLKKAKDLLQEA